MTFPFAERINFLLHGRRITPWGEKIGLNKGTTARMSKGQIPGHQILNLIQKVENVSLGWLVDGHGKPFVIHDELTDKQTVQFLQQLTDEPGWRIDMVTDQQQVALIGTLPAEIDFKGKAIPYVITEVICGEMGPGCIDFLTNYDQLYYQEISKECIWQIYRGELGSYQLVGDDKKEGLIAGSKPIDCISQDLLPHAVNEKTPTYHQPDIFERYNRLNDHNKESVSLIIDTLLAGQPES